MTMRLSPPLSSSQKVGDVSSLGQANRVSASDAATRGKSWGDTLAGADQALAKLAYRALVVEAELTPKPGLVDGRNNGSHSDMTLSTFHASASALRPFLLDFVRAGLAHADASDKEALLPLQVLGLEAEAAMHQATGHVNTHKGAIFAFGLLLGGLGRLIKREDTLSIDAVCDQAAFFVVGLVEQALASKPKTARTAGEYIYHRYGLTGARGEAESGFATVRHHALPAYWRAIQSGYDEETALLSALVSLMAHNDDTNLVARGGLDGLAFTKASAREIPSLARCDRAELRASLRQMDDALIARNLSPGGSADLLAVTWFLANLGEVVPVCQNASV